MKKTNATFEIVVETDCPHCEGLVNLMDIDYVTEEGSIYKALFDDEETWGSCKDYNKEIECTECGKSFIVEDITY